MSDPLWISEQDVVSMMDMPQAIDALEKGLLAEARGEASNMVKTHAEWGKGSTLHAIGAVFPEAGFVGTKTWAHTEKGATPLLILFDSNTGQLAYTVSIDASATRSSSFPFTSLTFAWADAFGGTATPARLDDAKAS